MKQPQLDNLVRIGQLKTEPAAAEEVQGLVRSGTRRLIDAAQWISPMRVSGSLRAPPMPTLPTSAMPPASMPSSPAPGPTQRNWAGTGSFMVNVRGRHRHSCVGAGPIADRPTESTQEVDFECRSSRLRLRLLRQSRVRRPGGRAPSFSWACPQGAWTFSRASPVSISAPRGAFASDLRFASRAPLSSPDPDRLKVLTDFACRVRPRVNRGL